MPAPLGFMVLFEFVASESTSCPISISVSSISSSLASSEEDDSDLRLFPWFLSVESSWLAREAGGVLGLVWFWSFAGSLGLSDAFEGWFEVAGPPEMRAWM